MKRSCQLSGKPKVRRFEAGDYQVTLLVDRETISSLIIELSLLFESLTEDLMCVFGQGFAVNISMVKGRSFSYGRLHGSYLDIQVLPRDLDLMRSFLLKYYRDGEAEVDHIDISICDQRTNVENGVLTLRATESKPGMTAKDAQRMLGIL